MDARRPVVVAAGRDREHEVILLVWSTVLGGAYLLGTPQPGSISAALPHAWYVAWALALLLGGAVGLVGCYWRGNVERGLELERGALIFQSSALVLYSVGAFTLAGWQALMAGGLAAAWVWGNARRARRITHDLRRIGETRRGSDAR